MQAIPTSRTFISDYLVEVIPVLIWPSQIIFQSQSKLSGVEWWIVWLIAGVEFMVLGFIIILLYCQNVFPLQSQSSYFQTIYNKRMSQNAQKVYNDDLSRKMAQIFFRYDDFMQNVQTSSNLVNPKRQSILLTQYPMEKKSKTLGTMEERTFSIDKGVLKQTDKNGQERQLPFPKIIQKEKHSSKNGSQWGFQGYGFRILMEFEQRNPIFVYFKTIEEIDEIFSFISLKISPYNKQILKQAYQKYYHTNLLNHLISKLTKTKMSKNYGGIEKRRAVVLNKVKQQMKDQRLVKQLILQWHKRTTTPPQKEKTGVLNVKEAVSELSFELIEIKTATSFPISSGDLKLWVGNVTYNQIFKFTTEQLPNQTGKVISIKLKNNEVKIRNETPPFNIWTVLQFQVETRSKEGDTKLWKSDKFYVMDLLKSLTTGPRKTITLWNGNQFLLLLLSATNAKCQALKINFPPQHEQFPSSYTYKLTPNSYPVLRELISKQTITKYVKSISPETIHLQYTIAFQEYLQNETVEPLFYSGLQRLYDLLQIQAIIQKFYVNQPYCQFTDVKHKGTFVYETLSRKADKFSYYDAEKFIWKYQCTGLRRFLSVIKAFDEFPRINYTEPFFLLCLQCFRICQKETILKWKVQSFESSHMGRQSLAFFMVLGILKYSSQLLLSHPNKDALANNSLIFHYVLKKHNTKLYDKFLNIQLNIEAFFGIESISLFNGLFNTDFIRGYGGGQTLSWFVLNSFIQQRKQQAQKLNEASNSPSNHYCSLVSIFLAMIETFDRVISRKVKESNLKISQSSIDEIVGGSSAYSTANCYLQYFRIFCCTQMELYLPELWELHEKYYVLCQKEIKEEQYRNLQTNLQKFHRQNSILSVQNDPNNSNNINTMNLGQLMEQLYSQFSCRRPKNQADIRKISIILDNVNLGQYLLPSNSNNSTPSPNTQSAAYRPASLIIQVLQSSYKLYQHQYIIPHKQTHSEPYTLSYQNIRHAIQLKLNRLVPLSLIITYSHNSTCFSYATPIDPLETPSNYYTQLIKQLHPVTLTPSGLLPRTGDLCTSFRYVCMQLYIKDSCDVDYIQNAVPTMYINGLLLRGRVVEGLWEDYRKDVIFCNHYFRSFRLVESNFNLLYAKLGWYGNHYLVPSDRIRTIYMSHQIKHPQPQSPHNNPQTLTDLALANIPEYSLTSLPRLHRQRVNEILFYTRCIYGRGLVPSIAYTGSGAGTQILVESFRAGKFVVRESKDMKNEISEFQYNCCSNLAGYLYENFSSFNHSGSQLGQTQGEYQKNFVDFYIRATQQLPLLRYLAFRPLQFYLLDQIKFTLKIPASTDPVNRKSDQVDVKAYSSNPVQQSNSFPKIKIMQSPQLVNKNSYEEQGSACKYHQIVLTNHPIHTSQQGVYNQANKFVTDASILNQQLYTSFQQESNPTLETTKQFYIKVQEMAPLPPILYFTYPWGIDNRASHDDVEGIGSSYGATHGTELLVDQFLWLLLMNIVRYYGGEGNGAKVEKEKQKKTKDKEKQKNRQKQIEKRYSRVLGCTLKFTNTPIPNTTLSNFYQLLLQTKLQLQLTLAPLLPISFSQVHTSSRNIQPQPLVPLILNPLYRHYTSFAMHNGVWIPVCILAKVASPNYEMYHVEEKESRKYRLFRTQDVILGLEAKRMLERQPFFKFTDYQLLAGRQCVRKQLIRIL